MRRRPIPSPRAEGATQTDEAATADLAGNYIAVGAGGAIAGGIGVVRLRNATGVTLVVRGPKLGVGVSVSHVKTRLASAVRLRV